MANATWWGTSDAMLTAHARLIARTCEADGCVGLFGACKAADSGDETTEGFTTALLASDTGAAALSIVECGPDNCGC
jgi:hypothetical protein